MLFNQFKLFDDLLASVLHDHLRVVVEHAPQVSCLDIVMDSEEVEEANHVLWLSRQEPMVHHTLIQTINKRYS